MRHHRVAALALGLLAAAAAIPTRAFEVDPRTGEIVVTSLTGFDRCVLDLSETPACLDALRRFANKRPNDSFQAGKRARQHYQHWRALSFFEIAFRKKASDAQCGDEDLIKFAGIRGAANDQVFVTRERERANGREFLVSIDGTAPC